MPQGVVAETSRELQQEGEIGQRALARAHDATGGVDEAELKAETGRVKVADDAHVAPLRPAPRLKLAREIHRGERDLQAVAGRQAGLGGAHEVLAQTVEVGRIAGVAGEALGGVDEGGGVAEFDPDAGGGFGRRRGRQGGIGEEGEEEKRRGHSRKGRSVAHFGSVVTPAAREGCNGALIASLDERMFANLFHVITRRPPPPEAVRQAFVEEVRVSSRPVRNARLERLILVAWILIAVKHAAIIWACRNYPVPFHQLWINFPTWLLGALATGLYFGRLRRG